MEALELFFVGTLVLATLTITWLAGLAVRTLYRGQR